MELDDGLIYKTPCIVWSEKSLLFYGSGSTLFVFDFKDCKLFKKIQYSQFNQNVRSIYVDKDYNLILVGFDNKYFYIYNDKFDLLFERSFSKKISFIASVNKGIVVGDLFGDISFITLNLDIISKNEKLTKNDCKIIVPFSHYSTITSSLIFNKLLFTGNKDGKIVVNYLSNLHEIKDFYLSHKMSLSCLDVVGDDLLLSLSIDNSIRFWSLSTGLEQCRLLIKGSKCLLYHLSSSKLNKLIFLLLLNEVLVINFNFDKLNLLGFHTFKLPFVCQTSVFIDNELYLVDHYSNLYKVKSLELLSNNLHLSNLMVEKSKEDKEDKSKPKGESGENNTTGCSGFNGDLYKQNEFIKEGSNTIKVLGVMVHSSDRLLNTEMLYNHHNNNNPGVKINIKKHVDLNQM